MPPELQQVGRGGQLALQLMGLLHSNALVAVTEQMELEGQVESLAKARVVMTMGLLVVKT